MTQERRTSSIRQPSTGDPLPVNPMASPTSASPPQSWPTRGSEHFDGVLVGPACEGCAHHDHPLVQCNRFVWRDGAYQQCQCGAARATYQPISGEEE